MEFLETSIFTKQIAHILSDREYARLQIHLTRYPGAGSLIPGAGGLRKIRWKAKGKGKRKGLRVIYYWFFSRNQIFMLLAYKKADSTEITKKQIKELIKITEVRVL